MNFLNNQLNSTNDRVFEINGRLVVKKTMWTKGGTEFMNGATFSIESTHGCYQQIINRNICFVNQKTLAFLSGKHIVIQDIISQKQQIIMKNLDDSEVSCMNHYQKNENSTIKIALGFKAQAKKMAQAKIYKSKKNIQQNFIHNHLPAQTGIIDIGFIFQSKVFITLAENTEQKESYVNIWKSKDESYVCNQTVDFCLTKAIASPLSQDEFFIFNSKRVYLWHYDIQNGKLNFQKLQLNIIGSKQEQIIDIAFLHDTPYNGIITNQNYLYFSKSNNLIQSIQLLANFQNYSSECKCISSVKKGFAIGFQGNFNGVHLYRQSQADEELIFEREIQVEKMAYDISKQKILSTTQIMCDKDETYLILGIIYNKRESNMQQFKKQKEFALNIGDTDPSNQGEQSAQTQKQNMLRIQDLKQKQAQELKNSTLLRRIDFLIFDFQQLKEEFNYKYFQNSFTPVFNCGVLKGAIVDMSICHSKNIIVLISEDKQFLVFEFNQKQGCYKCSFIQSFSDQLYSVSIHPLFIQVAIGLKEELKVLYLVNSEMKQIYSELTKQCFAVRYNQSGNILAAANYQNICMYNPYSFEILYILNSLNSGAINQLKWFNQDQILVSSCVLGSVQCWNLSRKQKMIDHTSKAGVKFTMVAYDPDYDLVIKCTIDNKVKLFSDKGQTLLYDMDIQPITFTYVQIVKEMSIVLFGTNLGTVRMYLWPFDISLKAQEFLEIPIHQGEVRCLNISRDFLYMCSGSIDGDIYFTKMREYQDGLEVSTLREYKKNLLKSLNQLHNSTIQGNQNMAFFITQETHSLFNRLFDFNNVKKTSESYLYLLNDLALWNFQSYNDIKDSLKELNYQINDLITIIDDKKANKTIKIQKKVEDKSQECKEAVQVKNQEFTQLKNEFKEKLVVIKKQLSDLQNNYKTDIQKIEDEYHDKLIQEYDQFSYLNEIKSQLLQQNEEQINSDKEKYRSVFEKKLLKYKKKYQKEEQNYSTALTQIRINQIEFEEIQKQEAEEFSEYLDLIKQKLLQEKQYQLKRSDDLRTSNTKFSKGIEGFLEKQHNGERTILELQYQITSQKQAIQISKQTQQQLKGQLKEKEIIINGQEQEIQAFRYKNQHLQNYKAVYDYKLQVLQDEQDPLNEHLAEIEKKTRDVYKDLLSQSNEKQQLEQEIENKNQLLNEKKVQDKKKKELMMEINYKIDSFQFEINQMLKKLDFENWQKNLESLYEKYFGESNNVINYFTQKNSKIGWKDKKLQEKYEKEKVLMIQDSNEMNQQRQEEALLKDVNQLNKIVKITNNQLNNKSNSDNNLQIRIKDQHDQAHDQNLILLNECNKLVEEKTKLKETLHKMIKEYEQISKEIDESTGQKSEQKELDVYQIISQKGFNQNFQKRPFYSPMQRANQTQNSPFIAKRDGSADNFRNKTTYSPRQFKFSQKDNLDKIKDDLDEDEDYDNQKAFSPLRKMKRLLKDIDQFSKISNQIQENKREQHNHSSINKSLSPSPAFRSVQNSSKDLNPRPPSGQILNNKILKNQSPKNQKLQENRGSPKSKNSSSSSSVRIIPAPSQYKTNSQQEQH
ncbi:WD repeat protein, putative (macronuclear) [Tetrahymena thermophila SB210]|uniref:WD repeat protein, putative n=1 Tax=Tetrahymena thermophila (strain SB210) TaxID=312017 RepID=Q232I2_TETTS|nr:WD repeat protein, putative [Tetrahymena thermophila SB210]EAR91430.2 WD repeat protein, putative [Tetrahymena thermophila SB210]|eukprot:XP_001011675.2 WD repeat protein, putative [Tetrahymena thermophila SB210]